MRTNAAITAAGLAGLAALACAGSVQAHHTHLLYQTTPVWISGTVTSFELKNPHAITTLEGRSENGQVQVWTVEGPSQAGLDRRSGGTLTADGDFEIRRSGEYLPKVGDTLEVCAYPYRTAEEIARDSRLPDWRLDPSLQQRLESTTEGASPRLVLGHLLVTTIGAMRVWEPYGLISDCMRSSNDQRESWIELLNANPEARKFWCDESRRNAVQSNAPLRELVEELNGLLDDPCQ